MKARNKILIIIFNIVNFIFRFVFLNNLVAAIGAFLMIQ